MPDPWTEPSDDQCLHHVVRPLDALHARLERSSQGYLLHDLQSTNGTFLNGSVCLPRAHKVLRNGDSLVFGRFAFEYWSSASAMLKL